MTLGFLLTTLIIVASPGTGVIYTLSAGLSRGAKASVLAAFSCTLGILPHLGAAMFGLAAILHASALAFNAIKYAGIAYLLFMAWNSLREKGALRVDRVEDKRSDLRVIVDGVLINILNPKLSIFFVAFLPQFVSPQDAHPLLRMLELSGTFMLATFVIFSVYGVFAAVMRDRVVSRPHVMAWMRRGFAAAFGALAVKLALTERWGVRGRLAQTGKLSRQAVYFLDLTYCSSQVCVVWSLRKSSLPLVHDSIHVRLS